MKRMLCLLAAAAACCLALRAAAEPLTLGPDLADEIRVDLGGGADYVYAYRYPQVDAEDPSAELINGFYQYKAEDAVGFEIPMNADYYRGLGLTEDETVRIDYRVTCNTDDFFGVMIHMVQGDLQTYTGHTFSRRDIRPGSSVALPYLLGLLESDENDTWLQDRQTARADALVRDMVWERLRETEGSALYEDLERESLEYFFFPEEDFYLDEEANPVFYLQPGFAEDSDRLLTFPISVEEILDEM